MDRHITQVLSLLVLLFFVSSCKETGDFLTNGFDDSGDSTSDSGYGGGDNQTGETGNIGGNNNNGGNGDGGNIGGPHTDNFIQDQFTEKYDFLWVVDNSGSMSNIRDFMSQKLADFANVLEARRSLDWQMAVTITDHVAQAGDLVECNGGVRVVTHASVNPFGDWSSIINAITGTSHAGWEQGLESGHAAIENYGTEFSRPNVPLVVSYVSDEEDYSCESDCNNFSGLPENQTGWNAFPTSRYADHFSQYKTNNGADVIVYPIVHLVPLGQDCDDNYGFVGARYMEVQSMVGTGEQLSLCEDQLDASFDRVAQLTANLGVCFTLTKTVSTTDGMVVEVDGGEVEESATDGYTYEESDNQVCFNGTTIPENGSSVSITYMTNDI